MEICAINISISKLKNLNGATSRYFEWFSFVEHCREMEGNVRLNNCLINAKETRIKQKGTRMVKDGED